MDNEHARDALAAALQGAVGVRTGTDSPYELPWPAAGPERSWVLTGRGTADKRRVRGAHEKLRRLLVGEPPARGRENQWGDFSRAMERRAVTEALTTLPVELREVVRLAYFEGLSNRAVADHLGMSVAGVRSRLYRALGHLEAGLRRAGSSLSGTLVAIVSGVVGRAAQGRELVVAAGGTVVAASAAVLLVSSPSFASGTVPVHPAPARDFSAASSAAPPASSHPVAALPPAALAPGPVAAGAGRPDGAPARAPAPGGLPPNPVATGIQAVGGLTGQLTGQVTAQVKAAVPAAPVIKPPGVQKLP